MNIPDGWKLVPVEPDEKQLDAAHEARVHLNITNAGWAMAYKAMCAASPSPPESRQSEELKQAHDDLDVFNAPRDRGGIPLSVPGRIIALMQNNREATLLRNATLDEAAAHLRDNGYWTQGAEILKLKFFPPESKSEREAALEEAAALCNSYDVAEATPEALVVAQETAAILGDAILSLASLPPKPDKEPSS